VDAKAAVPHQPAEAAAPRGERQRERARTQALGVKNRHETPDLLSFQGTQGSLLQKPQQQVESTPVVSEGRRREPALVLQRIEIVARQPGIRMRVHGRYSRALTPAAHSSPMRLR